MKFDLHTETTSIGSQDWLEVSKKMQLRAYLPPADTVGITVESLEESNLFTPTGYEIPVLVNGKYESVPLAERLNEAYGDGLEPEEKEFLDHAAEQFGRRLRSED